MTEFTTPSDLQEPVIEATVMQTEEVSATEQKYISSAIAKIASEAVVKVNKTNLGISDLQAKYGELKVGGLDDRANYLVAADGYKLVKKVRTSIETKRKELNAFPLKFQREVNNEAKRITELLVPIEANLKACIDVFENAEKAAKQAETERRHKLLIDAGFTVQGTFYVCGMHMLPASTLPDMLEPDLKYYLTEAASIIAAEKAAEERRRQEGIAAAAAKEALETERLALAKELEELAALKAEMQALKESLQKPAVNAADDEAARQKKIVDDFKAKQSAEQSNVKLGTTNTADPGTFVPASGHMWDKHNADVAAMNNKPAPTDFAAATDVIDENIANSGQTIEYIDGFEHCREAVITILTDPTPRKRGEFIELIKAIKY